MESKSKKPSPRPSPGVPGEGEARRRFPDSTYRLQLHAGFTFRQAIEILPYLRDLGITHCYASPYLKARAGSTHGYDVINHHQINPEIGSEADFEAWLAALREHGMGHILDIVPNHIGIATNENEWWNDVLENGRASRYSDYFDISWRGSTRPDLQDRVLLPVLGGPYHQVLEKGELRLIFENGAFAVSYYERRFPISPKTYPKILLLQQGENDRLSNDPDLREYREIAVEFGALQGPTQFQRNEQLKSRLASLADRSPLIKERITRNLEAFDGTPGDPSSFDVLDDLLTSQHYRLGYWKMAADEINYRRFFDVNELAALSMERPEVFEATHRRVLDLLAAGKLDGLRIDHPDGLYDPQQYFLRLQQAYVEATGSPSLGASGEGSGRGSHDPPLYVVVEKILASHERLPNDWAVNGTTGYDALNVINALFVDSANESDFTRIYDDFVGGHAKFEDVAYAKKLLMLDTSFASELDMLTSQLLAIAIEHRRSRDFTEALLREALRQTIACFPVYRTYISEQGAGDEDRRVIDQAIETALRRNPGAAPAIYHFIRDTLLERPRFAGRFQQLTAPVTAKGVEDTAFYVYNRLVSLNEVGGDPGRFGLSPDEVHPYFADRQRNWPGGLTPLSTHDTKRSEDVRARINVLSEIPDEWRTRVNRWHELNVPHRKALASGLAPSFDDEYLLYQTLVGAFPSLPADRPTPPDFVKRIAAYMQKAMREAKVRTRWTDPDADYESAVAEFVARILDPQSGSAFLDDFKPFQLRVAHWGRLNSLSQTLLRLSTPGVPDTYQGSELWDLSLVDPDNRRPVDYPARAEALRELRNGTAQQRLADLAHDLARNMEDGRAKLFVTWRMLELRRQHPRLFSSGEYVPLAGSAPRAENLFAFMRQCDDQFALIAIPRLITRLQSAPWTDTEIVIPKACAGRRWRNVFTDETLTLAQRRSELGISASDLFARFPVAALANE